MPKNAGALKFSFELKIRQAVMTDKLGHPRVFVRRKNNIESESYFGRVGP